MTNLLRSVRLLLWLAWHTRPDHAPGFVFVGSHTVCAGCGAARWTP
jgi:hypothetical protein